MIDCVSLRRSRAACGSPRSRRHRPLAAALCAAAFCWIGQAFAEAPPPLRAELRLNYRGAHMANVAIETGGRVDRVAFETVGLAWFFTELQGWFRTEYAGSGDATPARFELFRSTTRYDRRVVVEWSEGDPMPEAWSWKRGVPQDITVPEELWANAVDPVSAIARLRAWLAAGGRGTIEIDVFEGRRRYDLAARVLERGRFDAPGRRRAPAYRLRLDLEPISGIDEDDWMAEFEGDDAWIEVFVSDDRALAPLLARSRGGPSASVEWIGYCAMGARCVER